MRLWWGFAVLVAVASAGPAFADPCEAPVTVYRAGQTVTGMVRYVGDGDSLCVGSTTNPRDWIEIRLADYFAPELSAPGGADAKARLDGLVRGKVLTCHVVRGHNGRTYSYDRLIAACALQGQALASMLVRAGGRMGGNGYTGGGR